MTALADFNGDGFSDLAIWIDEDAAVTDDRGVNIIYGPASGLSATAIADWF